ncbi:MAG: penicillin-binding transpeptidase domain-containing protein [Anaerovoracaceae bacterium]|nr:penicillin-binding transpeptidase domain-containing protein [Bacillota bacterium]MDY2670176.1 penicillin-binding transpeptidase domain-containing protein [Anaerovoracaceae bacterium]
MAENGHEKNIIKRKKKGKKRKRKAAQSSRNRRLFVLFVFIVFMFTVVAARLGYIQIVKADKYRARAVSLQTRETTVTSSRGSIYDINSKALAINQSGYAVWAAPDEIAAAEKKDPGFTDDMTSALTGIFTDLTKDEIKEKLTSDKKSVQMAKYIDDSTEKKLSKLIKKGTVKGLQISATSRRYYPVGEFASHVIGITNDNNVGVFGIEQYYDQYLNGRSGKIVRSTDASGRSITSGIEKYYPETEGLNVVLTIDEVIQHYVENAIKQVQANTNADRVMAIAMNPKTGAVLAMADYPDFNLNEPRVPISESEKTKLAAMTSDEKVKYWSGTMWRNPMVSDTYEPGSPFKLITTSMALEEGLTSVGDHFVCPGTVYISGQPLRCWRYYAPHGGETLAQGVANSCNPVFIALSQRLGKDKFYTYLDRYGFDTTTGIDLPGETSAIIQKKDDIGKVVLATMSYGQGIAVTPIQLITAFTSIGNDGKMMKPRMVDRLVNDNGKTVVKYSPEVIRQVVSKSTADDVCRMMEGVVRTGTGKTAYIPGYRIGGKTGTAQKVVNGRYTDFTYSSFFAMAPMDDPQFAVLFIVDSPKGVHGGAATAGPGVHQIMSDCLKYLNITPVYTNGEEADATAKTTVPDVTGMSYSKAKSTLKDIELDSIACPSDTENFRVAEQYPKAGAELSPGDSVCLYAE